jgi:HPt (histidine-containing phosphotransfer) domain-containing protein
MNSIPVFDREQALSAVDGDVDAMLEIVDLFRATMPSEMADLIAAFERGEWQEASNRAHGVKGASATIGAMRISAVACEIELLLKQERREEARAALTRLPEEVDRFNTAPV